MPMTSFTARTFVPPVEADPVALGQKGQPSGIAQLDVDTIVEEAIKKIRESGGQTLDVGAVADTEIIQRQGTDLIGIPLPGGGVPVAHMSMKFTTNPGEMLLNDMIVSKQIVTTEAKDFLLIGQLHGSEEAAQSKIGINVSYQVDAGPQVNFTVADIPGANYSDQKLYTLTPLGAGESDAGHFMAVVRNLPVGTITFRATPVAVSGAPRVRHLILYIMEVDWQNFEIVEVVGD